MKTILVTLSVLFLTTFIQAQTAEEIIAKHIEAIGGKEKLSQVNSVYIETSAEVMGNQSISKTTVLNEKGARVESDFNGQSMMQVVTDKGGWGINPFMGHSSVTASTDEEFKKAVDQIYVINPLINYAAHGAKVELLGKEKTRDNVEAYKIKYTNQYNNPLIFYIDPVSFYIIEFTYDAMMMGQNTTIITSLSDYRKTDFGVVMPYSTLMDLGQFSMQINTTKIEFNKEIDMTIFDMPK